MELKIDNCNTTKKRGRPRVEGKTLYIPFKLRRGRSVEEDALIDRLEQLIGTGQRSRFIRRVLTTGDIDPILNREFARESEKVASALDAMASLWAEDEED
jgi:hypothetical protein